jgi:hypothetical protein
MADFTIRCISGFYFRLISVDSKFAYTHFKYVKKLSNGKFLDIRELDENFLTYYKIPRKCVLRIFDKHGCTY